jgi:hypothetical protein
MIGACAIRVDTSPPTLSRRPATLKPASSTLRSLLRPQRKDQVGDTDAQLEDLLLLLREDLEENRHIV